MADELRVPWGYSTTLVTLRDLEVRLLAHHHPEYVRRLIAWIEHKDGIIGVGGGWRADGTQPDAPGFAPEGKSFHQNQRYTDGFIGAAAVDLVKRNPAGGAHLGVSWSDTIPQGSGEAVAWGLHCNVGRPPGGEPWHMQPIELDGWGTATGDGTRPAPAPVIGYPLPTDPDPNLWRPPMGAIHMLEQQQRLADTRRDPGGAVTVGDRLEVTVPAPAGVTARAAIITLTTVAPSGGIHLKPAGDPTSVNNDAPGHAPSPNTTLVNVRNGKAALEVGGQPGATVHVIADLIAVIS